jgi:hypothetical protein
MAGRRVNVDGGGVAVVGAPAGARPEWMRPELSHRNRLTTDPFGDVEVFWDGTGITS